MKLIRRWLPDQEAYILSRERPWGQVAEFSHLFGERYFPVHEIDYGESYSEILYQVPIMALGMGAEEYETIAQGDHGVGLVLLAALVRSPYLEEPFQDSGSYVAIRDRAQQEAGDQAFKLVPPMGWPPKVLHAALDGTRFAPVAHAADWIHQDTGCVFLDIPPECNDDHIEWDDEQMIQNLADDWRRGKAANNKMWELCHWLEKDPRRGFDELVRFILDQLETLKPPMPKKLLDVFAQNTKEDHV